MAHEIPFHRFITWRSCQGAVVSVIPGSVRHEGRCVESQAIGGCIVCLRGDINNGLYQGTRRSQFKPLAHNHQVSVGVFMDQVQFRRKTPSVAAMLGWDVKVRRVKVIDPPADGQRIAGRKVDMKELPIAANICCVDSVRERNRRGLYLLAHPYVDRGLLPALRAVRILLGQRSPMPGRLRSVVSPLHDLIVSVRNSDSSPKSSTEILPWEDPLEGSLVRGIELTSIAPGVQRSRKMSSNRVEARPHSDWSECTNTAACLTGVDRVGCLTGSILRHA